MLIDKGRRKNRVRDKAPGPGSRGDRSGERDTDWRDTGGQGHGRARAPVGKDTGGDTGYRFKAMRQEFFYKIGKLIFRKQHIR